MNTFNLIESDDSPSHANVINTRPESSKSTTNISIFIENRLVSWGRKRQNCVSELTTESEYIALSKCAKKAKILSYFLEFINHPTKDHLFCDNQSTIAAIKRDDIPPKLKHVRVKYHAVKECIKEGFELKYITNKNNTADIFTKPLNRPLYDS